MDYPLVPRLIALNGLSIEVSEWNEEHPIFLWVYHYGKLRISRSRLPGY